MNWLLIVLELICGGFIRLRWQPVPVRTCARQRREFCGSRQDECRLESFWLPVVGWLTWTPVRRSLSPDAADNDPDARAATPRTFHPPRPGRKCARTDQT